MNAKNALAFHFRWICIFEQLESVKSTLALESDYPFYQISSLKSGKGLNNWSWVRFQTKRPKIWTCESNVSEPSGAAAAAAGAVDPPVVIVSKERVRTLVVVSHQTEEELRPEDQASQKIEETECWKTEIKKKHFEKPTYWKTNKSKKWNPDNTLELSCICEVLSKQFLTPGHRWLVLNCHWQWISTQD